ncbi:hypothetical protein B0G76_8435 [Paraburkholderia sp. BL23I1N1]|uniref:hypothetical protein n=1 Tax=Paraburkholderia sp. BL23I1N1 TaxID=1938802 RepID=UPI000E73696F|nr:hypothetical protein [Paraburkholderia sp. BL23I1N1]RKE23754.1 hypothetical protein B0G76_8435 [Paraburkholderia sp. BL23I1N1]
MFKLRLLDEMAALESVCFIPDARVSLKVEHKDPLYDYLCMELATHGPETVLHTMPFQRGDSLGFNSSDLVVDIALAHHEHRNGEACRAPSPFDPAKALCF